MKCPACSAEHSNTSLEGCCSRGCLRFHKRRTPRARPAPLYQPPAKPVIVIAPPVIGNEDKPCADCGKPTPDWAAYECGLSKSMRCVGCYLKWKEAKRAADDRATLSPPFHGSGGRVVRGTGSFS